MNTWSHLLLCSSAPSLTPSTQVTHLCLVIFPNWRREEVEAVCEGSEGWMEGRRFSAYVVILLQRDELAKTRPAASVTPESGENGLPLKTLLKLLRNAPTLSVINCANLAFHSRAAREGRTSHYKSQDPGYRNDSVN